MSPLADNEYFSDGVTEEILTLLARIEGLKVISRTSVMQYKGTVKPIRQIGEELGVGTILEGSVRHAGQRVRITAQLIDAGTDEHLWADRYDRDLEDIFEIQTDVAERIVKALRLRLTSRERSQLAEKPTESVEAYEWYLKGRHFLSRRTGTALQQAIDHFRKALTADPKFAQAWIGLADGLTLLTYYGGTSVDEVIEEARAAAEKALTLNPRLGEAHVSLGLIAMTEWKWAEADAHFRRGLELSPGYVPGYHWYGDLLQMTGQTEHAIATLGQALELDPLSLPVHMALGTSLIFAGREEEAVEIYRKALELDPGFDVVYGNLAMIHLESGRFEKALDVLEKRSRLGPHNQPPEMVEALRAGYSATGERGLWEAMLEELGPLIGHSSYTRLEMAVACAQLGRREEAFEHLERLVAERNPIAPQLAWDPGLASLRSDPRFEDLKRKLGLG
jgi:TolB-like protein/Flp pilus assembly protein TadD